MKKVALIIGTILIFSILMLTGCQAKTVTVTTTLPASTITIPASTVTVTNTAGAPSVYTTTKTIYQQTTVTRTVTPTSGN